MSTVTVWKFDTPSGADEALSRLERYRERQRRIERQRTWNLKGLKRTVKAAA